MFSVFHDGRSIAGRLTPWLGLMVMLAHLNGCAFFGGGASVQSGESIESTGEMPGSESMPFILEVAQEVNDGKELHILGSVKANTEWNPDLVVLRLTSLREGATVGVVHNTLRKLIESRVGISKAKEDLIKAGEETTFSLSVPSVGISDYQIVLLWGEEAEPYVDPAVLAASRSKSSKTGAPDSRAGLKLRVHSIEIETLKAQCPYPPCDVRFRLKAMLQNEGTRVIETAKLGVGFIPAEMVGAQTVPEEEEAVDVPKLSLQPGTSRPFRILLNQEMSEEVAETVRPVLRIISFE